MMKSPNYRRASFAAVFAFCIALLFTSGPAMAESAPLATLYSKQGKVEVRRGSSNSWTTIEIGDSLESGDIVRTAQASRAGITLTDGILVRLNENSRFAVEQPSKTAEVSEAPTLTVEAGDVYFFSRKPRTFPTIATRFVTAAIRGTEFTVHADSSVSRVSVLSGTVSTSNEFGSVTLSSGEESIAAAGKAPRKAVLVHPEHLVQWAMYYPAYIDATDFPELSESSASATSCTKALRSFNLTEAGHLCSTSSDRDLLAQALIAKLRGHSDYSLALLAKPSISHVSSTAAASRALLKASVLLERGQITAVRKIHHSLQPLDRLAPAHRTLLLLQRSMIALVQNDIPTARADLDAAKDMSSRDASGSRASLALANSYLLQASSALESAREGIAAALAAEPLNPVLKIRRAELALSEGDSRTALEESQAAIELGSADSYAYAINGFARLARFDPDGALAVFEHAIKLSTGDGLPFLGRGLALIRKGELESGRLAIQQAVQHEPYRALYRSYLGKALFEEEKEDLSNEEFARAIVLDPRDPTPYLYRSFQRLAENRPIEALTDIERSIKLNNNRSVYRSQLLLDQDNSVRSSSLAHLYNQLGFEEVSKIEAIKSLSKDYSNYSAHLHLSQSYDDADIYTQSAISEAFIAKLLAPVNFNLVRPNASSSVSSNEYSALFDRDLHRTSVGLHTNSRIALAEPSVEFSGTDGRWGYDLSYGYSYADGYRDNDSRAEHSVYGAVQYQLSPEDTVLLDTNLEDSAGGDDDIGFDPWANDAAQSVEFDDYLVRLGFNHRFTPRSQLIGQLLFNNSRLDLSNSALERGFYRFVLSNGEVIGGDGITTIADQDIRFESHGARADLQHIYSGRWVSNILGAGILNSDQELSDSAHFSNPASVGVSALASKVNNTESSVRAFNYSTFHLTPELDVQGGVSFARLHVSASPFSPPFSDSVDVLTRWDPKAGFVYAPTRHTTVRGAYFESIGTAGIRELELIEPTVLSGFNQTFFDIFPGTRSRSFALGIDQKLTSGTYAGVEALNRNVMLRTPFTIDSLFFDSQSGNFIGHELLLEDGKTFSDENSGRAYLYHLISKRVTATADYFWTQSLDHKAGSQVLTNRLRLGTQYFSPSGLLFFMRGTWRDQDLSGLNDTDTQIDGSRSFWVIDCGVGYRFAHRQGQVSLSFNNIFDRYFHYIPTSIEPTLYPGAGVSLQFSYNF